MFVCEVKTIRCSSLSTPLFSGWAIPFLNIFLSADGTPSFLLDSLDGTNQELVETLHHTFPAFLKISKYINVKT
jgi:hypothetical protein